VCGAQRRPLEEPKANLQCLRCRPLREYSDGQKCHIPRSHGKWRHHGGDQVSEEGARGEVLVWPHHRHDHEGDAALHDNLRHRPQDRETTVAG